jgi:hypothetical protein
MLVANFLVISASGHRVLSFLDGNAGYNQILWPTRLSTKRIFYVHDL